MSILYWYHLFFGKDEETIDETDPENLKKSKPNEKQDKSPMHQANRQNNNQIIKVGSNLVK